MTGAAGSAVARRTFADGRVRTASFALLLAVAAVANAVGYRRSYPTLQDRVWFARTFGANKVVELFYGAPHDLLTVGGYSAWRTGGIGSVIAGLWGMFAAVRALRAEEDAGRQELVLAGAIGRRGAFAAALLGIAVGAFTLWLALFAGFVVARLPVGGSAFLALATISPALVFVAVASVTSQIASTRRAALELATAVLVAAYLLRVVADTAAGLTWLRWATPFGWVEEMRAFAHPRPGMLALPILVTLALTALAGAIAGGRDVGRGLLPTRDSAAPRLRLLSSPTQLALRTHAGTLAAWMAGTGVFALVVGVLSTSFTPENLPENLRKQLEKLGGASLTTPAGVIGFYFLLFVLVISLFACSQVAAARREEAEQRLETLLALPVGRVSWLTGRLALAAGGAVAIALTASILTWAGAASQHADVSLGRLLEAGANCLPTALLFLALGALAFSLAPRSSGGITYGLVGAAFLWELFGALLGAPWWLLQLTPFHHIGLVPAQPFRAGAALAMLGLAAVAAAAGLWAFRRRDLTPL